MVEKERPDYMKSCFVVIVSILALAGACLETSGQQRPVQPDMGTELVRSLEAQKAEIESLRQDLKKESDLRRQQGILIQSLMQKLDALGSVAVPVPSPAASGVAEQSNVPTSPATDTDAAAAAVNATAKEQSKESKTVEAGFGKIKFGGLLQGWYAAGDRGFSNTFRLRRAEMKFTGELMPKVKWTIMIDAAKALSLRTTTATVDGIPVIRTVGVNQSSRILQDAFITLSYIKRANLSIGQFKIPLSREGLQSSSDLDTIERALFLTDRARGGGLGDARDLGVMVFGSLNKQIEYQAGIFNGVGENHNDVDQNDRKAFVGRVVFRPSFIKGLQLGASGAIGNGTRTANPRRDRLGAELVYDRDRLRIKGELMTGADGDVHRRGYYAHFGYRIFPKVEAIFRYDVFDPDIRREATAATVTERDYIGGVNYYIKDNNLKLQINYVRKTFATSLVPYRNLFIINLQTAW